MNKKIVVIGGVAAGATAAAKARRTDETAEITVIEKGSYISYANCGLPYYVGGVIKQRESLLLHTPESFGGRFNATVLINTEATAINRNTKEVTVRDAQGERNIPYDTLILAPGAATVVPPIAGITEVKPYTVRTVDDVDRIAATIQIKQPKSAVVIGGGFIGVETAENLHHAGLAVTVVEAAPHIMPMFAPEIALRISDTMQQHGITLRTNALVTKAEQSGDTTTVTLKDGSTITTDMLFLCTGVRPSTELAVHAGLEIGVTGGIKVNDRMQTSDPSIYAAGDAVEKINRITGKPCLLPLAGPANREGRTAGTNAAGGEKVFPGTIGTSVVGCFGATAAQTGLTEQQAKEAGYDVAVVYSEDADHASYYPGATYVFLKTIFDKTTGKVLGAAASGINGVEKRIDVMATAILGGLTVYDLEDIELCYAPQYGSAKDCVNISAFIASNIARGESFAITPQEYIAKKDADSGMQILDVRTKVEYRLKREEGARHIVLFQLRDELDALDKTKPVYIYCAVGMRGYVATRMLRQLGFEAYNVLGGIEAITRFRTLQS